MEFRLRSGKKVFFLRAKNGKVKAFPENDVNYKKRGTGQARKLS